MKSKSSRIFISVLLVMVLLAFPVRRLSAVSESDIRLGNIIGTGIGTLCKGFIQGHIHSLKDVIKCLGYGALAGYGFYGSKSLVAKGKVLPGILLANLSASVCENTARGENPLAYLGYSLPLVRLELATPLARRPVATLCFSFSTVSFYGLTMAVINSSKTFIHDGLLVFSAHDNYCNRGLMGWTYSQFPTVKEGQSVCFYNHEALHVVQNLQLLGISPEPFLKTTPAPYGRKPFIKFSGFRIEAFSIFNERILNHSISYDKRWSEIEAWHFTR